MCALGCDPQPTEMVFWTAVCHGVDTAPVEATKCGFSTSPVCFADPQQCPMEDHVRVVANEFVCSSYSSLSVEQLLSVACRVGFALLVHDCDPLFCGYHDVFFRAAPAPNRSLSTRLVESDAHARTRAAVPLKTF